MTLFEAIASEPHCLIAGATGSGKSVVINGVLHTIVSQKRPDQYRIVLIDPKRVELIKWRKVPHCMAYASEMTGNYNIIYVLKMICDEMDRRYSILQRGELKKWESGHIAVVVDELADIISDRQVKDYLCRLARLGRAANIHLIIASQRVSITDKLMPAEMRANIDTRLCLRVSESKDSRMVVGVNGAELLPMNGYGILVSPKLKEPKEVKVPYISERDIDKLIGYFEEYRIVN